MPSSSGPKLPKTNLLATFQPGAAGYLNTPTTVTYASDVATPSLGTATGPRRTINNGFGPAYDDDSTYLSLGPVMEIKNIPGSIYTINTSSSIVYTISLWVKIVSTPAVYNDTRSADTGGTLSTKSKRLALARFNYSSISNINRRGWIEFGAMAPYYLNNSNVKNYKSIFSPISFGAAIVGAKRIYSVYTDYKFNLNQWYLVTLQIESSSNFGVLNNQTVTTKMFVNNTQENIAQFQGIAWRQNSRVSNASGLLLVRRKRGAVAAQPGFLNRATGGTVSNASSQSFMFKYFPDLGNLNYISYSPLKKLDGEGGNGDNMNDGSTQPMFFGGNASSTYQKGSGVNFGQTYIYNTTFDTNIYTQFKPLYR